VSLSDRVEMIANQIQQMRDKGYSQNSIDHYIFRTVCGMAKLKNVDAVNVLTMLGLLELRRLERNENIYY